MSINCNALRRAIAVVGQFESVVKGHDFSRAVKAPKMSAGFSPCGTNPESAPRQFLRLGPYASAAFSSVWLLTTGGATSTPSLNR